MTITFTDSEQKRIFANNLQDQLRRTGKQQKDVAAAIGVSPQVFNTWCRGISMPRIGKLERLANYFGIKKTALIDDHSRTRVATLKVTKGKRPMYIVSGDIKNVVAAAKVIQPDLEELTEKYKQLSKENKEKTLEYIEFLLQKEKKDT